MEAATRRRRRAIAGLIGLAWIAVAGCEQSPAKGAAPQTTTEEVEWLGVRITGIQREMVDERHYRVHYTVANLHKLPIRVMIVAQFYLPGDDPETAAARRSSPDAG